MGLVRDPAQGRAAALESWASRWFVVLGLALVVGVLLPIVAHHRGGWGHSRSSRSEAVWLWDLLEGAPARIVVALLLPLALGLATLVVASSATGLKRAVTLFSCAAGALVLGTILGRGIELTAYAGLPGLAAVLLLLLTLGGTAIAVGNRLRRTWPAARTPRLLAGLGGCGVCLAFLLPVGHNDETLIGALLDDDAWEDVWPLALWAVSVLAYGVLGTVALRPTAAAGLYRATSVLGRCVLIGLPAMLLLVWLLEGDGKGGATVLLLAVKLPAILFGTPGVLAVALTAWIAHAINAPPAAGQARPHSRTLTAASGSAPATDLAARIARLDQARQAGLLSDAEYEVKRRQIIDSTDF